MTTSTRHSQPTLSEWLGSTEACIHNNISPMGDPLAPRHENDGIWRCGFQNIHGTTKDRGFEVPPELDAVRSLGMRQMEVRDDDGTGVPTIKNYLFIWHGCL